MIACAPMCYSLLARHDGHMSPRSCVGSSGFGGFCTECSDEAELHDRCAASSFPVLLWRAHRVRRHRGGELSMRAVAIAGPTLVVLLLQTVLVRRDPFLPPLKFTLEPFAVWRLLRSIAGPSAAAVVGLSTRCKRCRGGHQT